MKTVTICRRDHKDSADSPFESLFEIVLHDLRIPQHEWDDIDEVEIEVFDFKAY